MKMMRPRHPIILRRPGLAGGPANRTVSSRGLSVRSVAVCAAVVHCLTMARAADAPPARAPGSEPLRVQTQPYTPQGRQMKRYQAFARSAELPLTIPTDKTTLEVGSRVKTDIRRLTQLSSQEKRALAEQFEVPVGVIEKLVQRVANVPHLEAADFAQELRTAAIDYRFLQGEWGRYHPPTEGQKVKAEALDALNAGEIGKAWELYDALGKPQAPAVAPPQPPANLRVVTNS